MYLILSFNKSTFLFIIGIFFSIFYDTLGLLFSRTNDSFCFMLTLFNACFYTLFKEESVSYAYSGS